WPRAATSIIGTWSSSASSSSARSCCGRSSATRRTRSTRTSPSAAPARFTRKSSACTRTIETAAS
ncbi:MAG: hypothetical protein AVDCRST_MAG62-319, partial [uncultured Sphingomonas sp.]